MEMAAAAAAMEMAAAAVAMEMAAANSAPQAHRTPLLIPDHSLQQGVLAAQGGHAAAIAALLAAGAEINAKDNDGGTALMLAAEGGHAAAIEALLAAGAEINAKENDGMTALMYAEAGEHEHAARLLRGDAM